MSLPKCLISCLFGLIMTRLSTVSTFAMSSNCSRYLFTVRHRKHGSGVRQSRQEPLYCRADSPGNRNSTRFHRCSNGRISAKGLKDRKCLHRKERLHYLLALGWYRHPTHGPSGRSQHEKRIFAQIRRIRIWGRNTPTT
jgi:hypothetical protein